MPKYYFHVIDGKALIDGEGTNLKGDDEAREHAVEISTSLLKGMLKAWPSELGWKVLVVDASRTVIATLSFGVTRPSPSTAWLPDA